MKRLVYAPRASIYVKNKTGKIYDLSKYIVRGNVHRVVDQASTAEITLRNPEKIFTPLGDPFFLPMDPITIYLQRIAGHPIRVFTGFLDETPYYQMYPGTLTINASCTLKKLLYEFWNPALPYVMDVLTKHLGWAIDQQNGVLFNPSTIGGGYSVDGQLDKKDGSMGALMYYILKHVGGWDDNNILIEQLPDTIVDFISRLYTDYQAIQPQYDATIKSLMDTIIGSGAYGNGGGSTSSGGGISDVGGNPGTVPADVNQSNWPEAFLQGIGAPISECNVRSVKAWELSEGGLPSNNPFNSRNSSGGFQYPTLREGVMANVKVCLQDNFKPIVNAFRANRGPASIWQAIHDCSSPQRTSGCWCCGACPPDYPGPLKQLIGTKCSLEDQQNSSTSKQPATRGGAQKHIVSTTSDASISIPDSHKIDSAPIASAASLNAGGSTSTKPAARSGGKTTKTETGSEAAARMARQILNHPNAKFSMCCSNGPATMSLQAVANQKCAPVPATGGCVPVSLNLLAACLEMLNQGHPVYVNAITNGTHSSGSDHYKGMALDIGNATGHENEVIRIGEAHGGVRSGETYSGEGHEHFSFRTGQMSDSGAPADFSSGGTSGGNEGGGTSSGGGAGAGTGGTDSMYSIAKASAFATELNWPSIEETIESVALQGQKSLMDDKPLIGFIQQLAQATMRSFQSAPNGDFYAFFPDYFGEFNHRQPYWEIDDIEILDGNVRLSDAPLVTHMYVVGDILPQSFGTATPSVSFVDKLYSAGVMDIFQFFGTKMTDSGGKDKTGGKKKDDKETPTVNPFIRNNTEFPGLNEEADVVNFLQRYGVRPMEVDMPLIRSPFYEAFMALQQFMLAWSNQFITPFSFTFMPELYPGGQVGFPNHGLQMYIQEVSHNFDYEAGFTTDAVLTAPAAYSGSDDTYQLDEKVSWGMVNALASPVISSEGD